MHTTRLSCIAFFAALLIAGCFSGSQPGATEPSSTDDASEQGADEFADDDSHDDSHDDGHDSEFAEGDGDRAAEDGQPTGPMRQKTRLLAETTHDIELDTGAHEFSCRPGATQKGRYQTMKTTLGLKVDGALGQFRTDVSRLRGYAGKGDECDHYREIFEPAEATVLAGSLRKREVEYFRPGEAETCYRFVSTELYVDLDGVETTLTGTAQSPFREVESHNCR